MVPLKPLRPFTASEHLSFAIFPTAAIKCSGLRRGRSGPGLETSKVYGPLNGLISSRMSPIHFCVLVKTSKPTPSGWSIYTRTMGAFAGPTIFTVTMSTSGATWPPTASIASIKSYSLLLPILLSVFSRGRRCLLAGVLGPWGRRCLLAGLLLLVKVLLKGTSVPRGPSAQLKGTSVPGGSVVKKRRRPNDRLLRFNFLCSAVL